MNANNIVENADGPSGEKISPVPTAAGPLLPAEGSSASEPGKVMLPGSDASPALPTGHSSPLNTDHCSLMTGDCPPFSPAPGESAEAFAAFLTYFRLPGKRRMTAVARKTGVGLRTVFRWAHDFDWASRINRHQAILQQRAQLETARAREEIIGWSDRATAIREREWEITDDLLEALQHRLTSGGLDAPALAALARTLALTSKIARLTTGLTPHPDDDVNDGADPREEEFEAALKIAYGPRPATQSPQPSTTA